MRSFEQLSCSCARLTWLIHMAHLHWLQRENAWGSTATLIIELLVRLHLLWIASVQCSEESGLLGIFSQNNQPKPQHFRIRTIDHTAFGSVVLVREIEKRSRENTFNADDTFTWNDKKQQQASPSSSCLSSVPYIVVVCGFQPYDDDASRNCAPQYITVSVALATDFIWNLL